MKNRAAIASLLLGFAVPAWGEDTCREFNRQTLPEIQRQYQIYQSCLPMIGSAIAASAPRSIPQEQMDQMARSISQGMLDVMQFNRDARGAFYLEVTPITSRVLKQSFAGVKFTVDRDRVFQLPLGEGHAVRVEFEPGYSVEQEHHIQICQWTPTDTSNGGITAERCHSVRWLVGDLGIYRPRYESYNRIQSYNPFATLGSQMDLGLAPGCSLGLLKGHRGFERHNYAVAGTDQDLAPMPFLQFATRLSAYRPQSEAIFALGRRCLGRQP